jgi:hypothetical protein
MQYNSFRIYSYIKLSREGAKMQSDFDFVASVKKVSTQASKGGSIIITLEMDLTEENSLLANTQNKTCSVNLGFDNDSVEVAKQKQAKKQADKEGQGSLEFED